MHDTTGGDTRWGSHLHVVPGTPDGHPGRDGAGASDGQVLHRVAIALNSTLELRDVLHRLADLALDATGANRCSLFLLQDTRIVPAVALGRSADEDLWEAFREMGAVDLATIPRAIELLGSLEAVAVEDAATSDLIPPSWTERFGLRAVVLVPLHAVDEPCGVMVLDGEPSCFDDGQLRLLEDLGACAGVAVRNARTFEAARRRARLHEALARGAAELTASLHPARTADVLVDAYTRLLGARACALGLFDPANRRISTIATSRAVGSPNPPLPLAEIADSIVGRLRRTWTLRPRPVGFGQDPGFVPLLGEACAHHLVLPLTVGERVRGAVVLGFDGGVELEDEETTAAETLAAVASAMLERTDLTERLEDNVRRLEILSAVSTALVDGADADALVDRLDALLGSQGVRVEALTLVDPAHAHALRAHAPLAEEEGRGDAPSTLGLGDDLWSVPLVLDGRVVGTMRLRARALADDARSFLEAVGRGVADVVTSAALRSSLEDLAREHAVATARDVMAADLHDTIGQFLVAIGLLARGDLERLPGDSPLVRNLRKVAALADSGKWEVDQAVRALAHVPGGDRPLPTALRDLAYSFGQDSDIRVLFDEGDRTGEVSPDVARVLYRVAHEALLNAWRHGRCALVRMSLRREDGRVVLEVRDDGVGFGHNSGDRVSGVGLNMLRRLLRGVDGDLRLSNGRPRGALVVATVPGGPA